MLRSKYDNVLKCYACEVYNRKYKDLLLIELMEKLLLGKYISYKRFTNKRRCVSSEVQGVVRHAIIIEYYSEITP